MCFVDEAQDLSPLQWEIAHATGQKDQKILRGWRRRSGDLQAGRGRRCPSLSILKAVPKCSGTELSYSRAQVHATCRESRAPHRPTVFPKSYLPKNRGRAASSTSTMWIEQLEMGNRKLAHHGAGELYAVPCRGRTETHGVSCSSATATAASPIENRRLAVNGWEQLRKGQVGERGITARAIYGYPVR